MKIFDAHNDFFTALNRRQTISYIRHLDKYHKNVNLIAQIWTTKLSSPINYISSCKNLLIGKKKFYIGIEDLGFLCADNFNKTIKKIIRISPLFCGIVWNEDNNLGGGALGKSGLTSLGEKTVRALEKHGIVIDTAHMNRKTFYDFCRITTKPIFNSHTNLYELKKHKRNLDKEQIKQVISTNGLICLSFVKDFITYRKNFSVEDIASQISYAIKNYGYEHFAIGSDFFGTDELPNNLESYIDFDNLKNELYKLGISKKAVRCIFYKNIRNFIKRNVKIN